MRYYSFALAIDETQLVEKARINLKSYGYDNAFVAMNNYLYEKLENGILFCAYRQEESMTLAVFCHDEKQYSFSKAYEHLIGILNDVFQIKKVRIQPQEITMFQFLEAVLEGRRRSYTDRTNRIIDDAKLWIYYRQNSTELGNDTYHFSERIISEDRKTENSILDPGFQKELSNIEGHSKVSEYQGNMVHYIISGRSIEAAMDMTEILMQCMYRAKRISSRRMEIISGMKPKLYNTDEPLEQIIENNCGGVMVFDLSEKLGCDPVDYGMTCQYLENLVKKYRKDCLFVFVYNMEHPGFSYSLLPQLQKYVIPVTLREGTGNRRAAVEYLKELINGSEYAEYAEQASEYMKQYPGNEFTQTDVLTAFEKFGPWCLNKNILQAYHYDISGDFLLDRDENTESAYEKLHKMIGLEAVKAQIDSIIAIDVVEKERKRRGGKHYQASTMHMIFGGNPGSAKTTVAKLFAGIAKEKGILKSGAFVECGGMDLVGLGCEYTIQKAFRAAKGGVLFIDEAYSLQGEIAITTLLREMENQREDCIVILAGYHEKMKEFMERNEGLRSRIPYWINFLHYNVAELTEIFQQMLQERGFHATQEATKEAQYIFEKVNRLDNFGNGRYVRNLVEGAMREQSVRLLAMRGEACDIGKRELFLITKEDIKQLNEGRKEERPVGTAAKELEEMIGLSSVKEVIRKAVAGYKLKKLCMERGIHRDNATMHMVFTGNPGTAKTTVARLFAEIMKDEKILSSGNFVEVGRADLVGDHVGATAPLVKKRFQEAQGGVLFIDEAYSLCDAYENGFGDEAIDTIVQEMENHREDVIVIFAGYPEPMQEFLDRNPGMRSRIAFQVKFEDYTTEELCGITKLMLSGKQMTITDAAMEKLRNIYESARRSNDYGNGRFVRKVLEEAEMNLAERVMALEEAQITEQTITTLEESDITMPAAREIVREKQLGFIA